VDFSVPTDHEFLAMDADRGEPDELNQELPRMRREGRIQLFDGGGS
jgi:hypothetical protein